MRATAALLMLMLLLLLASTVPVLGLVPSHQHVPYAVLLCRALAPALRYALPCAVLCTSAPHALAAGVCNLCNAGVR